ncbi:MAG TPA: hypothetical protein VNO70_11115 [Blastocatellia bacterium]|nr:hypothetical protein [Blastocatellia bacterium]
MASKQPASEQRKKLMLAALGLVLVLVMAYQFLFKSSTPTRRTTATANANQAARSSAGTAPIQTARQVNAAAGRQEAQEPQTGEVLPLDLAMMREEPESATVGPRGNIFAYYVPPPPPPPKPEPPPPIVLQSAQPSGLVAGTPRRFTMTVTGQPFPPDAQIILNGRPKTTNRAGDNVLSTDVEPGEYAAPGNMSVEVKSASDPAKMYSNALTLVVQPAPEPPFKYVGRIGDQGVFELNSTKEIIKARPGGLIQGVWRVDAVNDVAVELTHTQYDIKKRIAIESKGR